MIQIVIIGAMFVVLLFCLVFALGFDIDIDDEKNDDLE